VFFLSCLAKTYRYIPIFFGFGLLFIGLSFMKTSMEAQVKVLIFAICSMSLAVFTHWFYHHRIGSIQFGNNALTLVRFMLGLSVCQLLLP
jgi:hypothetical protein